MESIKLIFEDAKSHKFWEVSVSGSTQTVRYGRVGTDGRTLTKEFDTSDKAVAESQKLAEKKRKKGYVDVPSDEPSPSKAPVSRIAALVADIDAWLEEHNAEEHEGFTCKPRAAEDAIAAAEKAIGVTLPDDYKEFLRLRNGTDDLANVVWGGLHQVEDLAKVTASQRKGQERDGVVMPDSIDARIRPVLWSDGWVVITTSARGRDHICIDLDPDEGGTRGQVFAYATDSAGKEWLGGSFTQFLEYYLDGHLKEERDEPARQVRP